MGAQRYVLTKGQKPFESSIIIDDEINEKDRIIYTSGFAGLFRSGIPVGRMFKKSNGQIDFFSKFTQLEYVKIVAFDMESQK